MKIAFGNDHAGLELKDELIEELTQMGVKVLNLGVDTSDSVDYPDIAQAVGEAVAGGKADLGVVVCGTGIGVCMAANKVPGIRAACCSFEYHARMAREHNHANVCCIGSRVTGAEVARAILAVFVGTALDDDERHLRRVRKVEALDDAH